MYGCNSLLSLFKVGYPHLDPWVTKQKQNSLSLLKNFVTFFLNETNAFSSDAQKIWLSFL